MRPAIKPVTIALLAYPETAASFIYGMYDMYSSAGRDWGFFVDGTPGPTVIKPVVVARSRDPIAVMNGLPVQPEATLDELPVPDFVCVPELAVIPGVPLAGRFEPEVAFLQRCHAGGAVIATACSGSLLLGEAGLLDGQDATTHWAYCEHMRQHYPKARVQAQRALVVSGAGHGLIMAGGGTSWQDLALYVIARAAGIDAAMQVAKLYLIEWHSSGQQPYARLARTSQVEDAAIAACQVWIADHYRGAAPVAGMARVSGLPERTFKRRFEQATGMAPLEYVHTLRLEEGKQMLEATDLPIEAIANEVGYEDAGFFSRLFKRAVNLTPAQYRKRFRSLRRALEPALA
ncbi:MAG TPA: helix-turn-helix domain-containing protein [Burkholderiaceae bacterium]